MLLFFMFTFLILHFHVLANTVNLLCRLLFLRSLPFQLVNLLTTYHRSSSLCILKYAQITSLTVLCTVYHGAWLPHSRTVSLRRTICLGFSDICLLCFSRTNVKCILFIKIIIVKFICNFALRFSFRRNNQRNFLWDYIRNFPTDTLSIGFLPCVFRLRRFGLLRWNNLLSWSWLLLLSFLYRQLFFRFIDWLYGNLSGYPFGVSTRMTFLDIIHSDV